ncbi:MAG: flagellar basal body rod protein FlgB [Alphaproteobacteria bacterium]|nr:flagellar basal body rod protein FlgB [Alphaproteobacteria bacterium]HPF46266.1 flagellar basal body rod protein FlgB [Emcibacteraceae bacterium]HRW29475.1 flagellar basal body rod protein FlgB [Emcibacteraceae bacterium]
MDLKNISLFKTLNQKMSWLNERQKVLAQNIANANTPGYVSQDLKKVSFQSHLNNYDAADQDQSRTVMKVSEPGHMNGFGAASARFEIKQEKSEFLETTPDGNTVDLERELSKMAEVQMEYTMATNLYKKHIGMLKMALGK